MNLLPTTTFLGKTVTRMIVGDNPQTGHSYIVDRITGDEMKAFYTPEKILETLFVIQDAGYNTIMPLSTPENLEILKKFRKEGGKLNIIFQPYTAIPLEEMLPQMLELEPLGIYHQGTKTDFYNETGDMKTFFSNLELLKNSGVKFGIGTHVPETVLRAERENWGADFYTFCMYNARRNRRGEDSGFITGKTKAGLVFYPNDRFDAYKVVQQVKKPFIAYKIFAGGQVFTGHDPSEYPKVAEAFIKETYENIKPGDVACIGVFQRDSDQARGNAEIVRRVLG
ncbi:MAG: hypothetical protein IJT83_02810 [Victivallales bacterium]|nr:hypothetical protein [Victivallales bacterium]